MEVLTRGKLARLAHVSPETIRFYEREGILPETLRAPNGYRIYSIADAERIRFVRRAKGLGFTLDQIRDLLKLQDTAGPACLSVKTLLAEKLAVVREKKTEIERLENQITSALKQCDRALEKSINGQPACPVFCCLSTVPDGIANDKG
jgi:MerR family transcriptional regulator, mercuric resistance operon regulatory protein